jgi:hypothetical protein
MFVQTIASPLIWPSVYYVVKTQIRSSSVYSFCNLPALPPPSLRISSLAICSWLSLTISELYTIRGKFMILPTLNFTFVMSNIQRVLEFIVANIPQKCACYLFLHENNSDCFPLSQIFDTGHIWQRVFRDLHSTISPCIRGWCMCFTFSVFYSRPPSNKASVTFFSAIMLSPSN